MTDKPQMIKFDIEAFAKKCGVVIVECGPGWGGKYGYKASEELYLRGSGLRPAGRYPINLNNFYSAVKATEKLLKNPSEYEL